MKTVSRLEIFQYPKLNKYHLSGQNLGRVTKTLFYVKLDSNWMAY